ncbi:MAG: hypothetical protein PHR90_05630 [Sphaerochaetaceae bacterium]|nr:hypothetical protein [Sphaerochaetaceae bacterium]
MTEIGADQKSRSLRIAMIKLFLAPVIWGGALSAGRIVSAELPAFTTSCVIEL